MSKKYIISSVIVALVISVLLGIMMPKELHYKQDDLSVNINMRVDADTQVKLYYLKDINNGYSEDECVAQNLSASSEFQTLEFALPTTHIESIRIDCDTQVQSWDVQNIVVDLAGDEIVYTPSDIESFDKNDILATEVNGSDYITIKAGDTDPYVIKNQVIDSFVDTTINYQYLVVAGSFLFVLIIVLRNRELVVSMIKGILEARKQIAVMSVNDFKSRFTGSYLGMVWGFIQPLMTILLFWFVFQVGFRSAPISNAPFILWLVAGMIPWNFFSDAWLSGNSSFTGYSYIVKKLVFNIDILPLVKIVSSSVLNIIFHLLIIIIYTLYGRFPGIHLIDMLYFAFCLTMLAWGLSMITSTLNVFVKDIGQLLGVIMQFMMWLTPIMWDYHMLPEKLAWIYKFNPLFYVVNGYREALIDGKWFFTNFYEMLWFWVVTISVNVIGIKLMKKLKPHFADVL